MMDFTDRHVFVAGGTSGINLGIAKSFAEKGARLAVLSRKQDKVDRAVALLKEAGAKDATGFACDVRDAEGVEAALKSSHEKFGEIDVLVSGAAGNFPIPALGMSSNAFKSVVDIDLVGTFHVLRFGFEFLKKPGASVINISAPQAFVAMPMQAHVCAAKAGIDMLTRTLALEWGGAGVRVNSIVPGPIDGTEGMKRLLPDEKMKAKLEGTVPLGRLGVAKDCGNASLFLASDLASYVTGVVLPVDGGWSLGGASAALGLMTG